MTERVSFDYTMFFHEDIVDLHVEAHVERESQTVMFESVVELGSGDPYDVDDETRRCLQLDALMLAGEDV